MFLVTSVRFWDRAVEHDAIAIGTGTAMNIVGGPLHHNPDMKVALIDKDNITVLDAGYGPGNMSVHVLRRIRRGKLYCLDPLPSMLKAAFDNLRGISGDVELNFLEATFKSIPLPSSSVDVIVTA